MHAVYLAPKVFLAFAIYFHFGNDFVDRYIASVGKRTRGMEPVKQNLSNIFSFSFFLFVYRGDFVSIRVPYLFTCAVEEGGGRLLGTQRLTKESLKLNAIQQLCL